MTKPTKPKPKPVVSAKTGNPIVPHGGHRPGAGRSVGAGNKDNAKTRQALGILLDGNVDKLQSWLDRIAIDEPKEAFKLYVSLIEYAVPKMVRQEVSNKGGKTLPTTIEVFGVAVGSNASSANGSAIGVRVSTGGQRAD